MCSNRVADLQDEQKLYLALEPCSNGDLYEQLRRRKPLPLPAVRAYAAEMVAMLACLREHRVAFRCACTRAPAVFGTALGGQTCMVPAL